MSQLHLGSAAESGVEKGFRNSDLGITLFPQIRIPKSEFRNPFFLPNYQIQNPVLNIDLLADLLSFEEPHNPGILHCGFKHYVLTCVGLYDNRSAELPIDLNGDSYCVGSGVSLVPLWPFLEKGRRLMPRPLPQLFGEVRR